MASSLAASDEARCRASAKSSFLAPFQILPWTPEVAWRYGQLHRYLSDQGMLIGANDLWIAATALVHSVPLVTRNHRHFGRAPGLGLLSYR